MLASYSPFFVVFSASAIRHRWVTVAIVIGCFVLAVVGFGSVKQAFFPESNTPMFFVDMWETEGTDIRKTREDTLRVSEFLRQQDGVVQTSTVIGGPHQRFTLVYDSKEATPVYAQIIVQTDTRERIAEVWQKVDAFMKKEMPWTDPIIKSLRIGPGRGCKIEARIHGPDPQVLRQLSERHRLSCGLILKPRIFAMTGVNL